MADENFFSIPRKCPFCDSGLAFATSINDFGQCGSCSKFVSWWQAVNRKEKCKRILNYILLCIFALVSYGFFIGLIIKFEFNWEKPFHISCLLVVLLIIVSSIAGEVLRRKNNTKSKNFLGKSLGEITIR